MTRAALVLAVALVALAGSSAAVAPPADTALAAARAEQRAAEAAAARLTKAADAARGSARKLAADRAAAAADLAAAEARISVANADLQLRRQQYHDAASRLAAKQAPIAGLVAGLVNMGRRPPMLAMIDGRSLDEVVRVRALLDATVPEIRRRSAALSADVERSRALQREAEEATKRLAEARTALAARKQRLAALEAKAAARADQLGSTALGAGDRVIAAEERASALGSERARAVSGRRLATELAAFGAAPRPTRADSQTSRPALAYRLPLNAPVTEGSGSVNDAGIAARGITLAARRGMPVAMPAVGTIAFAAPYGRHDGVVILDHGRGWMTLLTGVRAAVPKGSRLEAGAPLGKALGPVTVELSINGRPVSAAMIAIRSPVTGR